MDGVLLPLLAARPKAVWREKKVSVFVGFDRNALMALSIPCGKNTISEVVRVGRGCGGAAGWARWSEVCGAVVAAGGSLVKKVTFRPSSYLASPWGEYCVGRVNALSNHRHVLTVYRDVDGGYRRTGFAYVNLWEDCFEGFKIQDGAGRGMAYHDSLALKKAVLGVRLRDVMDEAVVSRMFDKALINAIVS